MEVVAKLQLLIIVVVVLALGGAQVLEDLGHITPTFDLNLFAQGTIFGLMVMLIPTVLTNLNKVMKLW